MKEAAARFYPEAHKVLFLLGAFSFKFVDLIAIALLPFGEFANFTFAL
jgi:hypothetical protein